MKRALKVVRDDLRALNLRPVDALVCTLGVVFILGLLGLSIWSAITT